jgi:hypothetical protein
MQRKHVIASRLSLHHAPKALTEKEKTLTQPHLARSAYNATVSAAVGRARSVNKSTSGRVGIVELSIVSLTMKGLRRRRFVRSIVIHSRRRIADFMLASAIGVIRVGGGQGRCFEAIEWV